MLECDGVLFAESMKPRENCVKTKCVCVRVFDFCNSENCADPVTASGARIAV